MTADRAIEAATRADPDALVDALVAMSESERRAIHDSLDELTRITEATRDQWRLSPNFELAALVALWATGTARDIRSDFRLWSFVPYDRLVEVVSVRPPKTIAALARTALADDMNRAGWWVVRDLVRRGFIEHPDSEAYYCGLVRVLPLYSGPPPAPREREAFATTVLARLREDGLLAGELIKAFDYEEAVNTMSGTYRVEAWLMALDRAIGDGHLDRSDLLDICVDGQLRDLRQSASAFFRKVFEGLAPTVVERAARASKLVRIVAASRPAEQAAAAASLRELVAEGVELDQTGLPAAVVGPLTGTHKGAAIEALRLLDAIEVDPADKCRAAVHGLGHPHADVQRASISIMTAADDLMPVDARAAAQLWIDAVAPACRAALAALVGVDATAATAWVAPPDAQRSANGDERVRWVRGRSFESTNLVDAIDQALRGQLPEPLRFDPTLVARSAPAVLPIGGLDELIEVLISILSGSSTAIDLERAIDGFARFSRRDATDQQLSPLRAAFTADYAWAGWNVSMVRGLVEVAARHWCDGRPPRNLPYLVANKRLLRRAPQLSHDLTAPPRDADGQWWAAAFDGSQQTAGLTGFVAARCWEAVTIGATEARPTLALPSTTDGWLDPTDLAARLNDLAQRRTPPGRFESVQALLRVRPTNLAPELDAAAASSVVASGLRLLCGDSDTKVADPGIARSACATAEPLAVRLVDFPKEGHNPPITVLRYEIATVEQPLRRDDPIGQIVHELVPTDVRPRIGTRWTPAVSALFAGDRLLIDWTRIGLPRHRAIIAAKAAALLAEDLDANRSSDTLDALISAATDPDVVLCFATHVLLAIGLGDRNVITSSAAADLVHDAANDGRLDSVLLGSLLAELTEHDIIKPARFAASLASVAPASPLVAERTRQVVIAWLGAITGMPRDLHAVLETLELACSASGMGIDSAAARAKLAEASEGGSKRAKAARRLASLPVPDHAPATATALASLLDRGERWIRDAAVRNA